MTNQELDKFIAENVMGWKQISEIENTWYDNGIYVEGWHPTTSISDAFQVVEKMVVKWPIFVLSFEWNSHTYWSASFATTENGTFDAKADTTPLAICLAAKKAMEA